MQLCIRAHDLGVQGTDAIVRRLKELKLDGVQLVCYKAYDDIPYAPGAITPEKAAAIGEAFARHNVTVPLVGAYFNPVHSDRTKIERSARIFSDYLHHCHALGCDVVGSETGSYSDDPWVYHPRNRTEEAVQQVVSVFSQLADIASDCGSTVAMEGAAGHVCYDVATLAKARRIMGRKTKVIFDLFNYLDASNQGDYLSILEQGLDTFAGDILLFHMKDCILQNGKSPLQTPFGQGGLDIKAILRRIKAYDPNAVLVLEETVAPHIELAVETINNTWESV